MTENNLLMSCAEGSEQGILGCLLFGAPYSMVERVREKDFYWPSHKLIFRTITKLHKKGFAYDLILVTDELEARGQLEDVGGFDYLLKLRHDTTSTITLASYCQTVLDYSLKRLTAKMAADLTSIQEHDGKEVVEDIIKKYEKDRQAYVQIEVDLNIILQGSEGYDTTTDWLIKDFIPDLSMGMVYAPPSTFKTFLAIDWASCIATGLPWAGNTTRQGAVLYIMAEGQSGSAKRIKAWEIVNNATCDFLYRLPVPVDFSSMASMDEVIAICKGLEVQYEAKIRLIVIDTLNRCFGGGDENKSQDMTIFVKSCDRLRFELQTGVLCLHHTGKDISRGARGSSVLLGAIDYEYAITRSVQTSYSLKCTKTKDFTAPQPKDYMLVPIDIGLVDEDDNPIMTLARKEDGTTSFEAEDFYTESNPDIVRLVRFMASHGCTVDEGKPHAFIKDEIATWYPQASSNTLCKKITRLMGTAIDKGYVSLRNQTYFLLVGSGHFEEQ